MRIPFTSYRVPEESTALVRRHWLTITFVCGFVIDNLTLNRVDQFFDNFILATYVVLAMVSMLVLYASVAGKLPERINAKAREYAPLGVQFAFGGLLSGMLIFYGRSGDWWTSWPFLLIIVAVIYGNETIRDRARRLVFNLAIFFIGLFSYVVLIVPVLTGWMGPWVFVASGVLALLIMNGFIRVLYMVIPRFMELQMRAVVFTIGGLFVTMNFLYFTNIIPPIPLSLTDAGIYHYVARNDATGEYTRRAVESPWWAVWERWNPADETIYLRSDGGDAFCYASVFAPTRLATTIQHRWQYENADGDWVTHAVLSYDISGGRGEGYRGFTTVQSLREGEWRCRVETGRGQVLGQERFTVVDEAAPRPFVTYTE